MPKTQIQFLPGQKVHYVSPDGRKVTAVVDSVDSTKSPSRLNLRVTATKDKTYKRGQLINVAPAFVRHR